MASVLRVVTVAPIPSGATLEGNEAVWKGRDGKIRRAELTEDRTRCRKIGGWQGRYTDVTGRRCSTRTFTTKNLAMMEAIRLEESESKQNQGTCNADISSLVFKYIQHLNVVAGPQHVEQAKFVLLGYTLKLKPTRLSTIDIDQINRWLEERFRAGWVTPKGVRKTYSARTRNLWVAKFRSFGAWVKQNLKLKYNPYEELPMMNEDKAQKKIDRRSLTLAEFDRLLKAASGSAKSIFGISGQQRAILYILAGYTGLRVGSIAKLTPESFSCSNGIAISVHSRASDQKTGNLLTVPFPKDVGREMANYLATCQPGRPLFNDRHWWTFQAAKMLRHDLAAAGIPFIDASGLRFDFHAFRYFLCLLVIKSGKGNQVAQKILGHSTPKLTANIYTKLGVSELAEEVQSMPPLSFGTKFGTDLADVAKSSMSEKVEETRKVEMRNGENPNELREKH